jgi:ABC-type Na+ transport system ATPase subunit NatA
MIIASELTKIYRDAKKAPVRALVQTLKRARRNLRSPRANEICKTTCLRLLATLLKPTAGTAVSQRGGHRQNQNWCARRSVHVHPTALHMDEVPLSSSALRPVTDCRRKPCTLA